jgi:hypothetical protein
MKVCSQCLEKHLCQRIGNPVTVETADAKVYSGVLTGVRVTQGSLKVVLLEGRGFRVVEAVEKLVLTQKGEEAVF